MINVVIWLIAKNLPLKGCGYGKIDIFRLLI
jgi:hypothetical protein